MEENGKKIEFTADELEVLMSALASRVCAVDSLVQDFCTVADDKGFRIYQHYVAEADLLHQVFSRVMRAMWEV